MLMDHTRITGLDNHSRCRQPALARGLIFVFCLAATAMTSVHSREPLQPPPQQRSLIFPFQSLHAHSSSLVETASGDILACWYIGSGERTANDVRIEGSVLRAGAAADGWSPPFLMVDTPHLPDCNPVLFRDRLDRIWLFWVVPVANRWENSVLKYRRAGSTDEIGRPVWDWQDSIHLVPGEEFVVALRDGLAQSGLQEEMWAEYALPYSRQLLSAASDPYRRQTGWMTRNHPITLPGGRILLPLYSDGFNVSLMAHSDDDGLTWAAGRPLVGAGPIQPTVFPDEDGNLVAYMRDSGVPPGRILASRSIDNGDSWTVARDTEIPNPGSSMEVIRIKDGRWVMVYNRSEKSRDRLDLAVSNDAGITWRDVRRLEPAESSAQGKYSYPSIIQSADGLLYLSWSVSGGEGESIRYFRISPSDL